ncbi:unnamed protein product [Triticum turgidum subsp. durum]|uniref:Uncharacterized protein n=2 Tax=Triticum TaxID=4564 RepID=A0A9R0XJ89_TRITD|nr:unnamed protein product [Triticum turgidum subsp. durum]
MRTESDAAVQFGKAPFPRALYAQQAVQLYKLMSARPQRRHPKGNGTRIKQQGRQQNNKSRILSPGRTGGGEARRGERRERGPDPRRAVSSVFPIGRPVLPLEMAQESWKEAEDTGVHAPEAPIMCINNCGFFGNRMTENMCSKCYRDTVKAKKMALLVENKTAAAVASSPTPLVAEIKDEASASAKEGKQVAEEEAPKPPSNRCLSCRKKVGLTGFKCRCGDTFCSMHRYADAHDCKFDYKQAGREQIAQQNPVVKADKVTRF